MFPVTLAWPCQLVQSTPLGDLFEVVLYDFIYLYAVAIL